MSKSILEESKKAKKKGFFGFIFRKKILFILLIVVFLGVASYYLFFKEDTSKTAVASVKRAVVQKEDLKISIQSDGKVVAKDGVELSFPVSGNLEVQDVYVKEGDKIKKGDKIAAVRTESLEFELRNAYSSYQSALANFNAKQAAPTDSEKNKSKAAIDQAQVSLDQAKISLEKTKLSASSQISNAESSLETAENNLKLNKNINDSEIVSNAYASLANTLKSIGITLQRVRRDSDTVLGIDETGINDEFENVLGAKNTSSLNDARNSYVEMRGELDELNIMLSGLSNTNYSMVDSTALKADEALRKAQTHLYDMQVMLDGTITSSSFSQTRLDGFKSTINSNRSSVNSSISSLDSANQSLANAKTNLNQYQITYNKAVNDLASTKTQAEQDIKTSEISVRSREISLTQAKIDYDDLVAPALESDLASARAQLTSAVISVDKAKYNMEQATLTSPIDGVVSMLNYKTGDIILSDSAKSMATIINNETLFIEVNIEEADISKLKIGQKASATFDAIDGLKLDGDISFISLTSETSSNGIVTYLVRVAFVAGVDSPIREGMTAAVDFTISGVSDVLTAPVDAVRNINNEAAVQKADGQYAPVVTGFTDGKKVEIISGLTAGDAIIY